MLGFFLQDKIECLIRVVLPVELRYTGIGVGFVIPELFFRLALPIPRGDKIVPLLELLHWSVFAYVAHGDSPS